MPTQTQLSLTDPVAKSRDLPPGTVFSIGHSNHPIDTFIELCQLHDIAGIVDVRSRPGSRFNPQYNVAPFKQSLKAAGIRYTSRTALGGMSDLDVAEPEFITEMEALLKAAESSRVAMCCSEKNPMDCHRSWKLAAWILRFTDRQVWHIHPNGLISGVGIDRRLSDRRLIDVGL